MLRRYGAALTDARRSRTRRFFYLVGGMAGLAGAVLTVLLLYSLVLWPFTPGRADLRQKKVQHPSVVLASSGEEVARFQQYHREWVDLDDVSPHVVDALIATEDHRFYDHGGVDVRRLVTATGWTLLGDPQGASTLPMQLARTLYPERIGQAWLPNRKLKEVVTALKIETVYEKDEIVEAYLNTVPFLYNVHGIELGARTYFSKGADELDVLEAATLVGMLKATTFYNPRRHPERAQWRRNVVLGQMVKRGLLEADAAERLKQQPIALRFERQPAPRSRAPHFTEHVRRTLAPWLDRHGYDLYTDGLVIRTPLDLRLQQAAQRSVDRQMTALQAVADVEWSQAANPLRGHHPSAYLAHQRRSSPFAHFFASPATKAAALIRETPHYRQHRGRGTTDEEALAALRDDTAFIDSLRRARARLETGLLALDPGTGHVKVWIGSRDYVQAPYDHVARARRQPGSTFKPIVFAAALEAGMRPDDTFRDAPVAIRVRHDEVWRPVNAGSYTGEAMTVREGLARSKNSIAAQVMQEVGPRRAARTAYRMGVRASELDRVPSLVLGTSPVTLREMVAAYATLASEGVYRAPVSVTQVEDRSGAVLATFSAEPERALREETARSVYDMLRDGVDYGTSQRVRTVFGINADVAGKTGTTQGGVDGWFFLMHPDLVAGAWVGFDDPRVAFRSDYWGQGAHNALYVVGDFYRTALRRGLLNPHRRVPEPTPPPPSRRFAEDAASWADAALEAAGEGLGALWEQIREAFQKDEDPERSPEAPEPSEAEPRWFAERGRAPERRAEPEPPRPPEPSPRHWTETPRERQERLERTLREVLRRREWREELTERVEDYLGHYDGDVAAMLRDYEHLQRDLEHELRHLERELDRMERQERTGW